MADVTYNSAALMAELNSISKAIESNSRQLEKITTELAGNGGPGLRTRVHSLETGYLHVVERLRVMEAKDDERAECLHKLDNRISRITSIGTGIIVGLAILEALRWIVPLLQSP